MSDRVDLLSAELARITAELQQLQIRVSGVEHSGSPAATAYSIGGFEVVSEEPASAPASGPVVTGFSSDRIRISRGIGHWLRRCLDSENRGSSGRDQIPLQSKFYLVARDVKLVNHNPPLVFTSWREAKPHCQVAGSPGIDSIYVGLPAQQDVWIVAEAAGLVVPAAFRQ